MVHALPFLLLAALVARPACGPDVMLVLAELNLARMTAGAAPVSSHPALCETAAARVDEIERGAGAEQGVGAINRRTRSLYGKRYAAHAWIEAAIIGGGSEPALEQFRAVRPRWHFEATHGDYLEVGAASGRVDDRPVWALLLALPRWTVEWRQAEPLANLPAVHAEMLAAVNRVRAAHDRAPLRLETRLSDAAQAHARDMLERAYYDHRSPDGTIPRERARAAGYPRVRSVSENIAKGPFSPSEVVDRWMNSSGHRRNILDKRSVDLGVGVAFGENAHGFEVVWVQLFAGN